MPGTRCCDSEHPDMEISRATTQVRQAIFRGELNMGTIILAIFIIKQLSQTRRYSKEDKNA